VDERALRLCLRGGRTLALDCGGVEREGGCEGAEP